MFAAKFADLSRDSRCLAFFLAGAALNDADIYVMINGASKPITFAVQQGRLGERRRVIDTGLPSPDDFRDPDAEVDLHSSEYALNPRSIVVLLGE